VLITFSVAYYAGYRHKQQARQLPQIEGILINPPQPLPPIDLYNQTSEPFSLIDLQGHWSLLMLDPAPGSSTSSALTQLIQVHNRLAAASDLQQRIRYLYLSRTKINEPAISFASISDNIQALHGDTQMIDKAFGGYGNEMEHSLILIGPKTKMHALFTHNSNAATIAKDLNKLITAMQ
jgi:cytochrome oxidase Cu insertion factor (SCO1/SenC/PrrC family)